MKLSHVRVVVPLLAVVSLLTFRSGLADSRDRERRRPDFACSWGA